MAKQVLHFAFSTKILTNLCRIKCKLLTAFRAELWTSKRLKSCGSSTWLVTTVETQATISWAKSTSSCRLKWLQHSASQHENFVPLHETVSRHFVLKIEMFWQKTHKTLFQVWQNRQILRYRFAERCFENVLFVIVGNPCKIIPSGFTPLHVFSIFTGKEK